MALLEGDEGCIYLGMCIARVFSNSSTSWDASLGSAPNPFQHFHLLEETCHLAALHLELQFQPFSSHDNYFAPSPFTLHDRRNCSASFLAILALTALSFDTASASSISSFMHFFLDLSIVLQASPSTVCSFSKVSRRSLSTISPPIVL
ncbi:hypothetical protein HPP92_026693 [Vanilla planifolia]|uniref:Uncharacterized protein n=1 Tax=Vanilla planifolia TaxID=51239 RepID=A0A835PEB0_VANPL|nr:hypothetical protein HPP92_026693 [Vanilla planifolia]